MALRVADLSRYWFPLFRVGDLSPGAPLACELLGRPLVAFRDDAGQVVVLEDRCPHRSVPLSLGSVRDGALECPYHGWQFGAGGACLRIPSQVPGESPGARALSLPVLVEFETVWVWPGTPEEADPALLPRELFREWGRPDWSTWCFQRDLEIDHELMIENLLDPAHLPFTHAGTLSTRDQAQALEVEVEEGSEELRGRTLWPQDPERRTQSFTFRPPCAVRLDLDVGRGRHMVQLHFCIPLGPGRMRMLFWFFQDFLTWLPRVPGAAWLLRRTNDRIVDQDLEMLAGQAERLSRGARPWGTTVAADALGVRYRSWYRRACREGGWFRGFADPGHACLEC